MSWCEETACMVLWCNNDRLMMKKNEVQLIDDVVKDVQKPKEIIKSYQLFQAKDRVKAVFNYNGVETEYYGTVEKYLPRSGNYRVRFDDEDVQYMKEQELIKIIV